MGSMEGTSLRRGLGNLLTALVYRGTGLKGWRRFKVYLAIGLMTFAAVWIPVLLFIQTSAPSYTCRWTLILPGTGVGSSINLESIGQAATAVSSPYTSPSLDPKVNYKAIAESLPVLSAAAEALSLSVKAFGQPRIKLIDQTALMHFTIGGSSAEQAYQKANALNSALHQQLERLRLDEAQRRAQAVERLVAGFQDKLQKVQHLIIAQQTDSEVVSLDQQKELTVSVEQLRRELAQLESARSQSQAKLERLQQAMGMSPKLAGDTLLLGADPLFRQHLSGYAETRARTAELGGKLGPRHPRMAMVREEAAAGRQAMIDRGKELLGGLGRTAAELERITSLLMGGASDPFGDLLRELITAAADYDGLAARADKLGRSLQQLETRLRSGSKAAAVLADLQRKHQVASAVFSSSMAKLDMGNSDPFASYPLVQMLAQPVQPPGPDTLRRKLALVGAAGGSFFVFFGLVLLWQRQTLLQKILKSA